MFREKNPKKFNLNLFLPEEISTLHKYNNNSKNINPHFTTWKPKKVTSTISNNKFNSNNLFSTTSNQKQKSKTLSQSKMNIKLEKSTKNNKKNNSISNSHQKLSTWKTLSNENLHIIPKYTNDKSLDNLSKTINAIESKYKKEIAEKDKVIKSLLDEISFLKGLLLIKNKDAKMQKSTYSLGIDGIKKVVATRKVKRSPKQSSQSSKFSFDLKRHEQLLSQRITKFYTPKASEITRNINTTQSTQGISSYYQTRQKTISPRKRCNSNKISKDLMGSILKRKNNELFGSVISKESNTNNESNVASSVNLIYKRVEKLLENLFKIIENKSNSAR